MERREACAIKAQTKHLGILSGSTALVRFIYHFSLLTHDHNENLMPHSFHE